MPFDGSDFSPIVQPTAEPSNPGGASTWLGAAKCLSERALRASRVQFVFTGHRAELLEPSAAHLLRRARVMIELDEKWVQGYYSTSDGRRCAMGALRAAARHSDPRRVRARANHLLRGRSGTRLSERRRHERPQHASAGAQRVRHGHPRR